MTKLLSLLKRIVGRIKRNMSMFFLTVAVVAITLGMSVLQASEAASLVSNLAKGVVILGIALLLLAYYYAKQEQQGVIREKLSLYHKDNEKFSQLTRLLEIQTKLLETMTQEIKELRKAIRGDRNERNNSDK